MKFSLKKHQLENKQLDWCELAHKIMTLENELHTLGEYLDPEHIKQYQLVIEDCEEEKASRVVDTFDYERYINQQTSSAILSEEGLIE
jgi:hypothetical protein